MGEDTLPSMPANQVVDDDITSVMRGRAALYALLTRVFIREVDEGFLAELRAMRYPQSSPNPDVNEAFKRAYLFMRHASEDVLDVLAVDYARTFLGSGNLTGNAAYPYESVYTSPKALVMQAARDEVLATYRANGVACEESWNDPEDHFALELDFMRVMTERVIEVLSRGDDEGDDQAKSLVATQYAFLKLHLLNWAPRFLSDVPRYASNDFYPAFAKLAQATLEDDALLLEDVAMASGIDLEAAVAAAREADAKVDQAMEEAAEQDHERPNVVVTSGEWLSDAGQNEN